MSSQQRFIRNEVVDCDAVLLDIEGTTTPISFVKVRIMITFSYTMLSRITKQVKMAFPPRFMARALRAWAM